MLSWWSVEGAKKIKDHMSVCLSDNMIDGMRIFLGDLPVDYGIPEPSRMREESSSE